MNKYVRIYSPEGTYYIHSGEDKIYYSSYNNNTFLKNQNFISTRPKDINDLDACNLFIEEDNLSKEIKFTIDIKTEIQDLKVNYERKEVYVYDGVNNKLVVLNYDTGEVQKEKELEDKVFVKYGLYNNVTGERLSFDNDSKTIALALEYSKFYMFDMNTLDIIRQEDIPMENDGMVFNKADKSYVLSFWTTTPYIVVCPTDVQREKMIIDAPICQGELEYSDKNKEIYLALHQQGQIYVYDAFTYKLKKKIMARYGVKGLNYNCKYNILITTSYLSGYLDIISLNDLNNKKLYSKFVHWHARRPLIYKDTLYIPTMAQIYKYNIKNLLGRLKYEQ